MPKKVSNTAHQPEQDAKVYLTYAQLEELSEGRVTNKAAREAVSRYKGSSKWQTVLKGSTRLIDYGTIPESYRQKHGLPDPYTVKALEDERRQQEQHDESERWLLWRVEQMPTKAVVRHLKGKDISSLRYGQLLRFSQWLQALNFRGAARPDGVGLTELREIAIGLMRREVEEGRLHSVADYSNPQSLLSRLRRWKKEGPKSLIDGRKNNKNASKSPDLMVAVARRIYRYHKVKLNVEHCYQKFQQAYKKAVSKYPQAERRTQSGKLIVERVTPNGEAVPAEANSFEWFRSLVKSDGGQRLMAAKRHGRKRYDDLHGIYVPTAKPTRPLALLSADDYDPAFWIYEGNRKTARRVKLYVVWDVATGVPLGFSAAPAGKQSQTIDMMMEALYDAVAYCGGVAAYEVELDNFGRRGGELQRKFGAVFQHLSFRTKAQGKYAERFNLAMQDEFWRHKEGFLGPNITAKGSENVVDRARVAEDYPVIRREDIVREMRRYRDEMAAKTDENGITALERIRTAHHAKARKMSREEITRSFGQQTVVGIRRGILKFQSNYLEHEYEANVTDMMQASPAANKHLQATDQVRVRYLTPTVNGHELYDDLLGEVQVYAFKGAADDSEDVHLAALPRLKRVQRAKADQDESEARTLGHHLAREKRQQEYIEEQEAKDEAVLDDHGALDIAESYAASKWTGHSDYKAMETYAREAEDSGLTDEEEYQRQLERVEAMEAAAERASRERQEREGDLLATAQPDPEPYDDEDEEERDPYAWFDAYGIERMTEHNVKGPLKLPEPKQNRLAEELIKLGKNADIGETREKRA